MTFAEIAKFVVVVVAVTSFVVAPVAWVCAVIYMFKTVAHRKPGVALWRDAPVRNPFNHILVSDNLTTEGLKYRRKLLAALLWFVGPIILTLGLAAVTGVLH